MQWASISVNPDSNVNEQMLQVCGPGGSSTFKRLKLTVLQGLGEPDALFLPDDVGWGGNRHAADEGEPPIEGRPGDNEDAFSDSEGLLDGVRPIPVSMDPVERLAGVGVPLGSPRSPLGALVLQ